jgi:hypothetical protein
MARKKDVERACNALCSYTYKFRRSQHTTERDEKLPQSRRSRQNSKLRYDRHVT